jgi:hypothetical protein
VENVQYAVRAGAEVGVDVIKTEYTGSAESFAEVVRAASPAKVVLAGGSPGGELRDYFRMTADALAAGAAGFTYWALRLAASPAGPGRRGPSPHGSPGQKASMKPSSTSPRVRETRRRNACPVGGRERR